MSYRLLVRPSAERDITEAQLWYEAQRRGLGKDFRVEVDQILVHLSSHPFMYPRVDSRTRRAVLHRFPYLLYFLVDADRVAVIACLHGHRDPKLLRSLLRSRQR